MSRSSMLSGLRQMLKVQNALCADLFRDGSPDAVRQYREACLDRQAIKASIEDAAREFIRQGYERAAS